jgi:nucleotide-binding universal stress UspA family protein
MRILLCTEGTQRSRHAIELCLLIAKATNSEVTIFGVTETEVNERPLLEALRQTQQVFRAVGVNVEIVSKHGEPITEISKRARETSYDLVVVGGESKPSGELSVLSQKAYEIIEMIFLPVLVVPVARPGIRRILICSGGGPYIERAVRLVSGIARDLGASATVFNVIPKAPVVVSERRERELDLEVLLNSKSALGKNLRAAKEMLEAMGVPVEVRVRAGIVDTEIAAEIEAGDYDLVVLGSKKSRDVFTEYLLGNVTRRLVNWVARPVLVVAGKIHSRRPRSWIERIKGTP